MSSAIPSTAIQIDFAPIVSDPVLIWIICISLVFASISIIFYKSGIIWRSISALAFILLFLNPSIIEQQRSAVKDVAAVVVDKSPSQNFGNRANRTNEILANIKK